MHHQGNPGVKRGSRLSSTHPVRWLGVAFAAAALGGPLHAAKSQEQAGPAEVEVLENFECDKFKPGVRLFMDRVHVLKEAPGALQGQSFVRGSINGISFRCTKSGRVTLLTPDPAEPHAASLAADLEARGFTRIAEPETFQLFGAAKMDRVRWYQKELAAGEEHRLGKWAVLVGPEKVAHWQLMPPAPWSENDGELLYNGIRLPKEWPPRSLDPASPEPVPVPYLEFPPEVIQIDTGRQLFVDDFLIGQSDLTRTFHQAEKCPDNPVLTPAGTDGEGYARQCRLQTGGVFYDPEERVFKMFYDAGWEGGLALATSKDLRQWIRPRLDPAGGNLLLPRGHCETGAGREKTVWLDLDSTEPGERLKLMSTRFETPDESRQGDKNMYHTLQTSADGRVWSRMMRTGPAEDYCSFFYNPFRQVWVYSIKWSRGAPERGRARSYAESRNFIGGADWGQSMVYWANADRLDEPDPQIGDAPQLYCLNAVAYESLLLGEFQIHLGPDNKVCHEGKFPKTTELKLGFSRDGFHWHRPDRRPFIAATRKEGDWDRGYLNGTAGVCVVLEDKLVFPYAGFSGIAPDGGRGSYFGAAIGIATLRRDGFASMDAGEKPGLLTTRPVVFGGKKLFVNLDAPQGELRVEVLDEEDRVIEPFSAGHCEPITADKTKQAVRWTNGGNLANVAGRPVKFRFHLTNGKLYAFWVSSDNSGTSNGPVGAGGPELKGVWDR